MSEPLLRIRGLAVDARTPSGTKRIIEALDLDLMRGETLCLAGESGSGKSLTALAIMRLLQRNVLRISAGSIRFDGRELTALPEREMRALRGGAIGMIFQEPMTALNPVMSIGAQMSEAIRIHQGKTQAEALAEARRMLDAVHITEAERRLTQFPHELSGGMRQRVMIGMALSCRPKLLIADEPTTALDVTVQAQILSLMKELKAAFDASILLITHDMGVVGEMADRVAVLRAGQLVECAPASELFRSPQQDYTKKLLAAVPRLHAHRGTDGPPRVTNIAVPFAEAQTPLLEVRGLNVRYGARKGLLAGLFGGKEQPEPVVRDVSFSILTGQTLGLVGESGSGKSTTGKAILRLIPFSGLVRLAGQDVGGASRAELMALRRSAQMIFQDPYASLDPRMSVGAAIREPLDIHRIGTPAERRDKVAALLARVRLPADAAARYPHEFSGGQRQRISIARALALEPKLIIADESVAALDVSVRAEVLDLMLELQETLRLSYLFISHDMAVIERMSHHVAVMRRGRIVEHGTRRAVFEDPQDSYTRALLDAVPRMPAS